MFCVNGVYSIPKIADKNVEQESQCWFPKSERKFLGKPMNIHRIVLRVSLLKVDLKVGIAMEMLLNAFFENAKHGHPNRRKAVGGSGFPCPLKRSDQVDLDLEGYVAGKFTRNPSKRN